MQEMDQEKLIENVRSCEPLYVMTHAKYSDIRFKENAWREIGKKIKQPATVCKKTWTNLRDSFRRALKKKREMKSGRPASKIKKWKFEDEMSFLIPHLQERETSNNLGKETDDNNDDEGNGDTEDAAGYNDESCNDRDDRVKVEDDKDDDAEDNDADDNDRDDPRVEEEKIRIRKKATNKKIVKQVARKKVHKLESKPVLIKYLFGNNKANQEPCSAIDTFFSSIASSVKNFSPYYQNIAKSKIFNIVTDLEMKQIMQCEQEQLQLPNTSTHRQSSYAPISTTISPEILESDDTDDEPHDVPCSSASVSPATTATPSPSPPHNFPHSVRKTHHGDKSVKKV